ncbi:LacI family DNA-binding transcriptional regulator [Lactococcus paracarnosus]|uniref:LacI family transcriptional regulator n=1 Tax=Pseudolactococcus paracarnosus TaxID=2749962 RepID=A0A7L4WBV9_9LACT|nr:LacI family DNA-binding transcriptional regulator [Lactococcus paracarnosus]SPC35945.1 Maltose operon transcriptional repressor MalR,LacI family [Lactococcus piscium]MCJ1976590.1 LacI family transcriptional regulator [Lactococcus paracarnosus]MCJ1982619.1 LacI family transcriptional regulator [Lactococcus paracarnosus]MCJ1993517.1 LacI family transcriptional regulator [Lactococcus paracarnosus]MCJ1997601.1 LacI family transcriptional regulator [Lactococcus paracarnosus]
MTVTIKDVAKLAGVNASTVSRAIHDSKAISDKTKEKVKKAMLALGYSRNAAAQTLASGKSGAIGVVFPPIENKSEQPFFMKILTAINEAARQNNITVSIASGHSTDELLSQVKVMYQEKRVDGFIVLYAGEEDDIRRYLITDQIPFVIVGSTIERANEITAVDNNNQLMGSEAANYLASLGHKQLAFISNTDSGEVFHERYQGFVLKTQSLGLKGRLVRSKNKLDIGHATGLVVLDDILAIEVIQGLSEQGISVPDDVSVISFNNSVFASLIHPYLTTFDINIRQLGHRSVQKLVHLLAYPDDFKEKVTVPFELKVRESTKAV